MTYTPTKWVNGGKPAINAENLNKIEEVLARLSIPDITETTSTTQPNSYAGREHILEIGGVTEQETTEGKNLLENTATSKTINGVTFTVNEDGSVTANGTASATTTFVIASQDTYIATNDSTYTLSGCPANGSDNSYYIYYQEWDSAWGDLISVTDYGNGVLMKHNDNAVYSRMSIGIANGVTCNNLTFKPMIRLASVTDDSYEPYTGGIPAPNPSYPQEIKKTVVSGIRTRLKNFFDITTLTPRSSHQGGAVSFNGDVANISSNNQDWATCYSDEISVENGKSYVFSFVISNYSASTQTYIEFVCSNVIIGQFKFSANGTYAIPIKPTSNEFSIRVCSNGSVNKIENTFTMSEAQLEEGTVKTEYQRFQESSAILSQPIELYGMNGVQDVITPKEINRKWAKKRIVSSMNISHEAGWAYPNAVFIASFFPTGVKVSDYTTVANILCTHAITAPPANIANGSAKNAVGQGGDDNLFFSFENCTTVEEVKAFLDTNEVYVYYQLATPTTEALPIADQIALNSLATYDGITYVEFDAEIQPTFKGEYGTSKVGGYTLEALLAGRNGELK